MSKTVLDKIQSGRQYRSMTMQVRAGEKTDDDKPSYIVEGYATTFNQSYPLWEEDDFLINEQVDSKALDGCDFSDVIFQYDHSGRVFARGSNKTLEIKPDEHGLFIRADLGGTETGRQLYEEIKGGYTNKMSFGFTVDEDEVTRSQGDSKDIYLRTIKRIGKLYDVSAVSLPANDSTEISARSFCDGVIAERKAERLLEAEREKQRVEAEQRARDLELLALRRF